MLYQEVRENSQRSGISQGKVIENEGKRSGLHVLNEERLFSNRKKFFLLFKDGKEPFPLRNHLSVQRDMEISYPIKQLHSLIAKISTPSSSFQIQSRVIFKILIKSPFKKIKLLKNDLQILIFIVFSFDF